MEQQKVGSFLKELRREKNITQEQLAEVLSVTGRTVSRWETGSNMPDISILVELADFYDVSIPEIIDGERKSEKMNEEIKETAVKMAEFSNSEKEKIYRRMHWLFIAGCVAAVIYLVMLFTDSDDCYFGGMCLGITIGMCIVGTVMTSKNAAAGIKKLQMKILGKK